MSKQQCKECGNSIHSELGRSKCYNCIKVENDE